MQSKHFVKRLIIVGTIFLITLGFVIPSSVLSAPPTPDPEDGIWSDSFDDPNTVDTDNCHVLNGTIVLEQSTNGRLYDFRESNHKAYSWVTNRISILLMQIGFFSPDSHIKLEYEFGRFTQRPKIKKQDNDYAERSSGLANKCVVHHFRFKLDVDADSIGNIEVYWYGKGQNHQSIDLYLWKLVREDGIYGTWEYLKSIHTGPELYYNISQEKAKLAVSEENYLDICIIASPSELSDCTLFTDYIKIVSQTEKGYEIGYGTARSKIWVEPKEYSEDADNFYWDILTWRDYERGGATVKYHVLYENETNYEKLVEDEYFSEGENSKGFTDPPICLNAIPHSKLKIMANLSTDTSRVSPKIFSWTLTWQKDPNRWQDLFNSEHRMDLKNKINVSDGKVTIKPISGNWPMLGHDPQNTRSSEGKGPDSDDDFNWYSVINEGKKILDPVVMDEDLFVTYLNSKENLYRFDITKSGNEDNYSMEPEDEIEIINDKVIVSSPVVTEDYIIIATGQEENGGTDNYVYALSREDYSSAWTFEHDEKICYSASPVVSQDKVFITSWSGDTERPIFNPEVNNRIIALDLENGEESLWEYELPARSYSTPAVYEDMVVVGCSNGDGDSLFALDAESGDEIWNKSVGAIRKASPVIYDNYIFIVSKKAERNTIVTALRKDNGTTLWEKTISSIRTATADTTPAVYDDVLYVASPNGRLLALNVKDGTEKWSTEIYSTLGIKPLLLTSPTYADGRVYIGTPGALVQPPVGAIYAFDATDGKKKWDFETFEEYENFDVSTSPVVSNGQVFFGDENGKLYSIGNYTEPDDEIEGSLISIPINLPKHYWWNKFHAEYQKSSGVNDIVFSILDEDKNIIKKDIENESSIVFENKTIRTIRLKAELSADNSSVNPQLLKWNITFVEDNSRPFLNRSTFTPNPDGWLNEIVPIFTIEVKENLTGLDVGSAQCILKYATEEGSDTETFDVNCSGEYGTTDTELIIIDITTLDFYENITELDSLEISIKDLADNEDSELFEFKQDTRKPTSSIKNETNDKEFNTSPVVINATADDPGILDVNASDVDFVELYYRHSYSSVFSGSWQFFGQTNETPFSWNFTAEDGGGHYELTTRATDKAGNEEDEKEEGDVTFIFDPNIPDKPDLEDDYWFNSLPVLSVDFEDDFKLDKTEYRPNFEPGWTEIDSDINAKTYDDEWGLAQEYWDQMQEGEEYYLYFRLTDTLGNIRTITNDNDALKICRDETDPNTDLEIPSLETEWSWDDTLTISAFATDGDGSGIKTVELYYRYSEDNKTWGNWTKYGDTLTLDPFNWEFKAEEGNGYYEFKIVAEDRAGNVAESQIFSTGINIFPLLLLAAMIGLVVVLIIIITALFVKWRKKEE